MDFPNPFVNNLKCLKLWIIEKTTRLYKLKKRNKPLRFFRVTGCLRDLFPGTAPEGYCIHMKKEGITTHVRW
jgi:hypothetical protein